MCLRQKMGGKICNDNRHRQDHQQGKAQSTPETGAVFAEDIVNAPDGRNADQRDAAPQCENNGAFQKQSQYGQQGEWHGACGQQGLENDLFFCGQDGQKNEPPRGHCGNGNERPRQRTCGEVVADQTHQNGGQLQCGNCCQQGVLCLFGKTEGFLLYRRLVRGGHFVFDQVIRRHMEQLTEPGDEIQIRHGAIQLPLGHGLPRDSQFFGECFLRKAVLLSQDLYLFSERHRFFLLWADLRVRL